MAADAASADAGPYAIEPGLARPASRAEPARGELQQEPLVQARDQYVANLPENVKKLIRVGIKGRQLTPADYDQLFRLAKKIDGMPQGQAADYASKVTGSTTSLDNLRVLSSAR